MFHSLIFKNVNIFVGFLHQILFTGDLFDGGRLVFLFIEGIRRKPVPPKYEGLVHAAGLMLLLMLMVYVTGQDILRLLTGKM